MRSARLLPLVLLAAAAAALPAAASAAPRTVWLCRPGLKSNPCGQSQRTTVFSTAETKLRVEADRPRARRKIDCFYVYPTVSDQKTDLATLHVDPEERSIALYQAARYSHECRVFAPMYRQHTLAWLGKAQAGTVKGPLVAKESLADVVKAWKAYLDARQPRARGRVHRPLPGLVPAAEVPREVRRPEARRAPASSSPRSCSVATSLVKKGTGIGGDFKHIPACRRRAQTGCVIAFSTYDATPPKNSLFGRAGGRSGARPRARRCCARTPPRSAAARASRRPSTRPRRSPRHHDRSRGRDRRQRPARRRPRRGSPSRAPTAQVQLRERRARAADHRARQGADAQALARPDVGAPSRGREHRARQPRRHRARGGRGLREEVGRVDVPGGFSPYPDQGPFLEAIGPVQVRDGGEELVLGLRAEERHTNHRGTVQGGLLSTFVDFALGRAIEADADDGKDRATVSLTVDFLKPAQPGDWIVARTRVDRVGATLSFADCSLEVEGKEVVRARAVWVVAG